MHMFWHPQTACITPWNNHALIEAYNSTTHPICSLPIGFYIGMKYHPQYRKHPHHMKGIKEGHNHHELLHIHHLITLLQGGNHLHRLAQA